MPRFNPTMVRLLLGGSGVGQLLTNLFQSHNGAIAAPFETQYYLRLKKFQSHNGAIAARTRAESGKPLPLFQSHNGAIAASVGHVGS